MLEFRLRRPLAAVLFPCLVALAACDDEESIAPLTPAEVVSTVTVDTLRGLVNAPLSQDVSVKVTSPDGRPIAGVPVAWAAAAGSGIVSDDTTRTDPQGVARATWTIGSEPDAVQTLTATVAGLTPVTFVAKGAAADLYAAGASEGNEQLGLALEQLPLPVGVRVIRSDLSPVPGVAVTWAVASGGGTVDSVTTTTDANGVARNTWTIGAAGAQALNASVPGLPAPVVLTATPADPCLVARVVDVPATLNRSLEAADCNAEGGFFAEFFDLTVSAATNVVATLASTAFTPVLSVTADGSNVAVDDAETGSEVNGSKLFLAPGTYRFGATSAAAGGTGAYTLSTAVADADMTGCEMAFIVPGATSGAQTISNTDCASSTTATGSYFSDQYRVYLNAGETITVTQESPTLDSYIIVFGPTGFAQVDVDGGGPGDTEEEAITATVSGVYVIDAGTFDKNEFGAYTLTVTR